MSDFQLHGLRDSFTADVTQLLAQIDTATAQLLKRLPEAAFSMAAAAEAPVWRAIGDSCHAVLGTSELVAVTSLSQVARRMEALAQEGVGSLAALQQQVARVQEVVGLCRDGGAALHSMLELELNDQADQAAELASAWMARAAQPLPQGQAAAAASVVAIDVGSQAPGHLLAMRPQVPVPVPPGLAFDFSTLEPAADAPSGLASTVPDRAQPVADTAAWDFSFAEEPPLAVVPASLSDAAIRGPAPGAQSPAPSVELLQVFQSEARTLVAAVQVQLHALHQAPQDLQVAEQLERTFLTLKGAAASVGLSQVEVQAQALMLHLTGAIDRGAAIDADFLAHLERGTAVLLDGIGPIAEALSGSAAGGISAVGPPGAAIFQREAIGLLAEAEALVTELGAATPARRTTIGAALRQLWHQLRGSALLVAEPAVAATAAALEELATAAELPPPAAWAPQLAALQRQLAPAVAAPTWLRAPVQLVAEPELVEAIHQECSELLSSIDRDILALDETTAPKTVLGNLFRSYHTLKGALNTLGMAPTGRVLHGIEDFVESLLEAESLPPLRPVTKFLLEIQAEVLANLRQAEAGYVNTSLPALAGRLQRLRRGEMALQPAPLQDGSGQPRSAAASSDLFLGGQEEAGPAYVRVGIARLDALLNFAGELLISRSGLVGRLLHLRGLRADLKHSRQRLLDAIGQFREKFEFSNLDGRRRPARALLPATLAKVVGGSTVAGSGRKHRG